MQTKRKGEGMAEPHQPGQSIDITASPSGIHGVFKGAQSACVAVLIVLGGAVAYMQNEHDKKEEVRAAAHVQAMQALKDAVERQAEMQQAFVYVQALPQSEREKLNLAKPRILFEMERGAPN